MDCSRHFGLEKNIPYLNRSVLGFYKKRQEPTETDFKVVTVIPTVWSKHFIPIRYTSGKAAISF